MGSNEGIVAMSYYPKAQETKPPLIANENAYLGDISSSDKNDSKSPISAGFYRLEKGKELLSAILAIFLLSRCALTSLDVNRHPVGIQVPLP